MQNKELALGCLLPGLLYLVPTEILLSKSKANTLCKTNTAKISKMTTTISPFISYFGFGGGSPYPRIQSFSFLFLLWRRGPLPQYSAFLVLFLLCCCARVCFVFVFICSLTMSPRLVWNFSSSSLSAKCQHYRHMTPALACPNSSLPFPSILLVLPPSLTSSSFS